MRKLWLFFIALGLLILLTSGEASADAPQVDILEVKGTINPVLAGYVDRGIGLAEEHGATACIIELNTPGGLLSSTQDIVERILESNVPVVVYVNHWAGSAGAFITIAAHVACMAPMSRIGASTPVSMGEELSEEMQSKITEDTAAWMRSIAEKRNRNVEAAEATVREAASYTDEEAFELGLIDLRADSLESLLLQLDGMEVHLDSGEVVTLETEDANVNHIEMGAIERFLFVISDPNIAYILLSIGMLGIMLELFNPGTIFPGVVGAICLFLAFYALGMLPVNYAGIILIVLAFALFIAEVFITSHGLLALGGIASFTIGSLILMTNPLLSINPGVIAAVVIVVTAIFVLVIGAIVRTHRKPQQTGLEAMVGKVGVARTTLDPKGTVFVFGERWEATVDEGKVEPGEEVIITKVEGLKLRVTKKK